MSDTTNVYQRLLRAQHEIKAPRQDGGRFGKARSAEQILEQAKPICFANGLLLTTSDIITEVNGRNYVTATARVVNVAQPDEQIHASASAWEGEISRGLDAPQVTGAASSYAKKYALQNLLAIDDSKDDPDKTQPSKPSAKENPNAPTQRQLAELKQLMDKAEVQPHETADFFQGAIGKDRPETKADFEKSIQFAETLLADQEDQGRELGERA